MKKLVLFLLAVSLIFGTGCAAQKGSAESAPPSRAKGIDNPMYDLDTVSYFPFILEKIEWGTSYEDAKQQLSGYDLLCEEGRITVTNPRTALKQDTVSYVFFFEKDTLTSAAVFFDEDASVKTVMQHLLSRFGDPVSQKSGDCTWIGTRAELCLSVPKGDAGMVLSIAPAEQTESID